MYASGCRVILAKQTSMTFSEAQAQAWQYFENALSVHTELLYTPTGLPAVQALAIMVRIFGVRLRTYFDLFIGFLCGGTRKSCIGVYDLLLCSKISTV